MSERKLVTVKQVTEIRPIPDADAIECAIIGGGWPVVVKKGEFKVGDSGVYFEIDSFLPAEDERFAFLLPRKSTFEDREGIRIKTMKLRGQISQGLFMPLANFPEVQTVVNESFSDLEDLDMSGLVGVVKWEPKIPACLAGQVKGLFPVFIYKTDQERVQNLVNEVFVDNADSEFEITMKLDGSSGTFYYRAGEVGVCSRNLELKVNEENADNTFIKLFHDLGLRSALEQIGENVAIQAEVMGPGVQGNREQLKTHMMYVFNIFDIDNRKYLSPFARKLFMETLYRNGFTGKHVPVISEKSKLPANNIDDLLAYAEGPSITHPIREGHVYKRTDGQFSFKVISNKFLLKSEK